LLRYSLNINLHINYY